MSKRRSLRVRRAPVVIDGRAFEVPLPETRVSISELLTLGTAAEAREGIEAIAMLLREHRLSDALRNWLADALDAIGRGKDPRVALGLRRRKQYGIRYARQVQYIIADLGRQGMSRTEARDLIARLDIEALKLNDRSPAAETVKKRLQRSQTRSGTRSSARP